MSLEHVFPKAIGGTYCIKSVCKSCNDRLGHSVDDALTNHKFIEFQRMSLRIPGQSGAVPNPLAKGVLASDSSQAMRSLLNDSGQLEPYLVPSVRVINGDGEKKTINFRIDSRDKDKLTEMVNKKLKRLGQEPLSREQIEAKAEFGQSEHPEIQVKIPVDLIQYKRAIMKIAYEMACTWLGDQYTSDALASTLRECIFDTRLSGDWSEKYPIHGQIIFRDQQHSLVPFINDRPYQHIVFLTRVQEKIAVYVRIFEIFDALIEVSQQADRYVRGGSHFLAIDPVTGVQYESTFEEEVRRLGEKWNIARGIRRK
jgi:hypothetical protein